MRKTSLAIKAAALCLAVVGLAALLASPGLAETTIEDGVRVTVKGKMNPNRLPRRGTAPIGVRISGRIIPPQSGELPKLTRLTIELNHHGWLDSRGLPRCHIGQIRPSSTRQALAACGKALVGEGSFAANVKLPEQSPFPSNGKVLAFNGYSKGRPAILAHIYGTDPLPTSYVLPFTIGKASGVYGTVLRAEFPEVTGEWGYVTGISMNLHRRFAYRGRVHGYLNASCPAPRGFTLISFPLARTSFEFDNGAAVSTTLLRTCHTQD